jgi:hypothetical protein
MVSVENAAPVAQWIEHAPSRFHDSSPLDALTMTWYYENVQDVGVAQWIEQATSNR